MDNITRLMVQVPTTPALQDAIDAVNLFDLEIMTLEIKIKTIKHKQDEIIKAFGLTNEDF